MKKILITTLGIVVLVSLVIAGCAAPAPVSKPAPTAAPAAPAATSTAAPKPTSSPAAAPAPKPAEKLIIARGGEGTSGTTVPVIAVQRFVDNANKALAGRLKLEHYPSAQLYQTGEDLSAIKNNVIQFGSTMTATMETWDPGWAVFNSPVLFDDEAHFMRTLETDAGKALLKRYSDNGLTVLGTWFQGASPMFICNGKRPVEKMADFKGLKIRSLISDTYVKTLKLLGASVVAMPMGEVAAALQTGMIDGQLTGPPAHKLTLDFTPYVLKFTIFSSGKFTAVNTAWWNSLPADIRDTLKPIIDEAMEWGRKETYKVEEQGFWEMANAMVAKGKGKIVEPSPEFASEMRATLKPIWDEVVASKGKFAQDLIDAANKTRK